MSPPPLRFGPFVLDAANARLTRQGTVVELPPRTFELLRFLAERPGRLVTKDELLDGVWGRRHITEAVIKTAVSELRAALDDDAREPRYVETVPRRGYRFVAEAAALASPPAVAPVAAAAVPAAALAPRRPGLPQPASPLIGRETELASLLALLSAERLVCLSGPGGVGKTRLALAAAAAWSGRSQEGAAMVELAPLAADSGAAALRAALAQALRLAPSAAASDESLCAELAASDALVLLDNAEHVVAEVARLAQALVERLPQLRLLVTSQEPLAVPGERVLRLAPLSLPPEAEFDGSIGAQALLAHAAPRLFAERVAARLPGFALTDHHAEAVAALCRELDGLPLAIELAAARVPLLGVQGLRERLQDGDEDDEARTRFALLNQGARTAAPRQRTLRDALQWSHALLSPAEQRVFRRLSVFRGGFTLAAAEHVCAGEGDDGHVVADRIGALVDKSLVVAADPLAPVARLRLLESPRALAAEQLAAAGEEAAARRAHAEATLTQVQRAQVEAQHVPALAWLERHGGEIDNLRAAMRWALQHDTALAVELLHAGARVWIRLGLPDEGARACEALRPRVDAAHEIVGDARLTMAEAVFAIYGGAPIPPLLAALERAMPVLARSDSPADVYAAWHLVYVLRLRSDPAQERASVLRAMVALEAPDWSPLFTGFRRMDEAQEDAMHGRIDAYLAFCRREWQGHRDRGEWLEAWNLAQMLMPAEYLAGRLDAAVEVGRQAVVEIRAAGRERTVLSTLTVWLQLLAESGACAELRTELVRAAAALRDSGRLWMVSLALPWLAWHEGRTADAVRLLAWRDEAIRLQGEGVVGPYTVASRQRLGERLGEAAAAGETPRDALPDDAQALAMALSTAARR